MEIHIDEDLRFTNKWSGSTAGKFNIFFTSSDGKKVNNSSGFKIKKCTNLNKTAFVILSSTMQDIDWPDYLDRKSGVFTYFGDNKKGGRSLHETSIGGNSLLDEMFKKLLYEKRDEIVPFLCFKKSKSNNQTIMTFLGVAAPGMNGKTPEESLLAIWKDNGKQRYQNYKAYFTILNIPSLNKLWLQDIISGLKPIDSTHCPQQWRTWVNKGQYAPLITEELFHPRTKDEQIPTEKTESEVLQQIKALKPREFEFFSKKFLEIFDPNFENLQVTKATVDGGRDITGFYKIGQDQYAIRKRVLCECKHHVSSIGTKKFARLLSRSLKHDILIFITTSYYGKQLQQEVKEDDYHIIMLSGIDLVHVLQKNGIGKNTSCSKLKKLIQESKDESKQ